jgi:hypothetical protein
VAASNYDAIAIAIAIHSDFENISNTNTNEDNQFSIFQDPTASIQNKENITSPKYNNNYDDDENPDEKPQRKLVQPSIIKSRKPLNLIEETEVQLPEVLYCNISIKWSF